MEPSVGASSAHNRRSTVLISAALAGAMTRLCLTLLGGFELRTGTGTPLNVPTRKAQGLVAYLALTADQVHPRDKLAALLWPDSSPGSARNALRQTLFVVRKALALAGPPFLVMTGDAITLPTGS